ncbi:MAG: CHAD domain-containing protein, partial [Polaromonas sp.]|nr:CHAD domain-containing protein [Polaromonas sp.]
SWPVKKRGGSLVEVSLDIGQIVAGGQSAPVCELELELLAGHPSALFEVAQQIARSLAALPLNISKSERGYALLQGSLMRPLRAKPPALTGSMSLPVAAQSVLREMFCQFTTNLNLLRDSDDPEVLHQARVGWRRFKSALRLFKPELAAATLPSWQALGTLMTFVGELRDLDVARLETLPRFAAAYTDESVQRQARWQALLAAMDEAAALKRRSIGHALEVPAVGSALLAITQWLEELPAKNPSADAGAGQKNALRHWARARIARLHQKMEQALKDAAHPESLHRARLLAKRLRYGIEALRPVLRQRQARGWLKQATRLQTDIGLTRDVHQAGVLASQMEVDTGLAEFLRGLAVGQAAPR